ncbi:MAG: hypothetical protein KC468_16455 [Myxococcales bacterium]|nr:hypothetical protein [Myxococcales bacterium]
MRAARAHRVLCLLACACAAQRAPAPTTASESVAPEPAPAAVASEPAPAPSPAPADVDPPITRPFTVDALMLGVCALGSRVTYEYEPEGPIVFRDGDAPAPFREGEPLWVITAGGGLERARVKRAFRYCPLGDADQWEPEERAELLADRGWSEFRCWPAAELEATAALRCEVPLRYSEALASSALEPAPALDHFLALPRDMSPPTVVPMTASLSVHGARCQDPDKDFDEPGAFSRRSDPETPVSRVAREQHGFDDRWARQIIHYDLAERTERLHVVQAARIPTRKRTPNPRRDLFLVERAGAFEQVWPRAAKGHRGAGQLLRDHFCGLPFFAPLPMVAIASPEGDGLLLLVVEDDGAKAALWSFGSGLMTTRRAFTVEHEITYF